ncbi:MAG: 2-oxoglutarate dehydrogenase E1 component [Magnetococcales bacterium]|nr:2-oxoglutarate dehydrogenase E1 component [Magnetococcales bacterium]
MSDVIESFLTGANAHYVLELYARFLQDPQSVDPASARLFARWDGDGPEDILRELHGADWNRRQSRILGHPGPDARKPTPATSDARSAHDPEEIRKATLDSVRALMLIRSYRVRGHLHASFDPLGLEGKEEFPELKPETYGFTAQDMDRPIFIDWVLGRESATMREILHILEKTYCSSVGVEFMHIQDADQKAWIQRHIENNGNRTRFSPKGKKAILERLIHAEQFEKFLQKKFTGTKRFGLEGGESLIPALDQLLERGAKLGIREVVLGMAHRGRLNVLANIMQKPYRVIFHEFQGGSANPEDVQGSGDVRYHLGSSADRIFDGHPVHLTLNPNPSHLELVNPVVLGKVRSKQNRRGPQGRREVMAVLLHGDAAFAGQGLVAESLALSGLEGYATGGTIHLIINNQIGFTTHPSASRSSPYPSDVGKMIQAPIFHVNGDDPEAVVHAVRLAVEFRQEFGWDVIIDMFCYRRHGHNESDEPMFTQPIMYRTIAKHRSTPELYARQLDLEGQDGSNMAAAITTEFNALLEEEFALSQNYKPNRADWLEGGWKGLSALRSEEEYEEYLTDVPIDTLKEIGHALAAHPEGFAINSKIARQLRGKKEMMETGRGIDWATAEALAFGSLLLEGVAVRLSGQDCGRGTFSQRQSVLVDQETEARYLPLNHIRPGQALYTVHDSPLAEASVLGYEYGYASDDPSTLVLWEAQFGDFANGAQMIIDQFLSAGESKWLRLNGVTLLLPHGYEGQGPEHSSGRPERFLQLCAEDNLQVCNVTTPANYFHVLRRQIRRNFRKPLVLFTPKSLLRHPECVSGLEEFTNGARFMRVLPDPDPTVLDSQVTRVILCTGKVHYDLLEARNQRSIKDVALIRIEQLYPWPRDTLLETLKRFPNAQVVWCQEEPANMGAWMFVLPRLTFLLQDLKHGQAQPGYAGRPAAASPATGLHKKHVAEQSLLVEQALTWTIDALPVPFRRITGLWSMTRRPEDPGT